MNHVSNNTENVRDSQPSKDRLESRAPVAGELTHRERVMAIVRRVMVRDRELLDKLAK